MLETPIFISYASPDADRVQPFYEHLKSVGIDPWMDRHQLKPGQNWDFEIRRALDRASVIVVFVSSNSVDRRGYAQREIKLALRKLEEKLAEDVYLIPVRLDDVPRPEELRSIHFIDADDANCLNQLSETIREQLSKVQHQFDLPQRAGEINWRVRQHSEKYDGMPGYALEAQFISLESRTYPRVDNAAAYICGEISDHLMSARQDAADQDSTLYHLSQNEWSRTNTMDINLSEVVEFERSLSVLYVMHFYYAGAAHPNSAFMSYNFFLSPLTRIKGLKELFGGEQALEILRSEIRKQLRQGLGEEIDDFMENWIKTGTESWEDLSSFVIAEEGLRFFFAPYQVGPYAAGPQTAMVRYELIVQFLNDRTAHSLGLFWQRKRAQEKQA